MSIIDLLHRFLKERLPCIHTTRLQALMAAVQAGLKGASVYTSHGHLFGFLTRSFVP